MTCRKGIIIFGLLLGLLSACGIGDRRLEIDSVSFGWETAIQLYRRDVEESQMSLGDCLDLGNDCAVVSDSCHQISPADVGELTHINTIESTTQHTTLFSSANPTSLPEETQALLDSAPLGTVAVVVFPEASQEERYRLHVLAERFVDDNDCWPNEDELSPAIYDQVCTIGERINIYELDFLSQAVLDLVCTVEVAALREIDRDSETYRENDLVVWPDLEAAEGQEISSVFSGWAIFTAGSYTYTLSASSLAEYEALIARYQDHLQSFMMIVDRNGNEKEIIRRE
jgi:hypothetical protein